MTKFRIDMYSKVEDKKPKLYNTHEEASLEREKIAVLQPEVILVIERVYDEQRVINE